MPEDNEKTLPKDSNSDYSMPGRFEESNSELPSESILKSIPESKNRGLTIAIVLFAVFSVGIFSYYFINQSDIDEQIIQNMDPQEILANQYNIGKFGSDHAHAAIVVIIDEKQVNFAQSQFQVSNKYIHFENNNPYQIHKHATGVPLEMLFVSFGMKDNCISNEPCIVYLNGERYYFDILQYEIKHDDRILISVGEIENSKYLKYLESLKIFDVPKKSSVSNNDISI